MPRKAGGFRERPNRGRKPIFIDSGKTIVKKPGQSTASFVNAALRRLRPRR